MFRAAVPGFAIGLGLGFVGGLLRPGRKARRARSVAGAGAVRVSTPRAGSDIASRPAPGHVCPVRGFVPKSESGDLEVRAAVGHAVAEAERALLTEERAEAAARQ